MTKRFKQNHSEKISSDIKTTPMESVMPASKLGKNKGTKDVLNKCALQIKKPSRSKTSPLNWVLRKKGDSYLERKIKLLQQVDGMNLSLDETLGDSNPHYSRVLREKIAIREAAEKAMEARKVAMVEASWCRILRAARIESKEAEAELARAEKRADEAFEAATAVGVIMNDIPNRAKNMETATSSRVTATFETEFEVDKQVAAAVKAAFIKLASSPLTDKDVFIELLHKISQNPDMDENCVESTDFTLEFNSEEEKKCKKRQVIDKFHRDNLVEMMLDRLRLMEENELASLATIVATCGLNAALAEAENDKRDEGMTKRTSSVHMRMRRGDEVEVPSLDKFLVKRMTRLEREVLEAKNGEKASTITVICKKQEFSDVPSLDKVLVKRMSRLERVVEEARSKRNSDGRGLIDKENMDLNKSRDKNVNANLSVEEVNDKIAVKQSMRSNGNCSTDRGTLDSVLVKHVSRLEREKRRYNTDGDSRTKLKRKDIDRGLDSNVSSLDQVLVKRKCTVEREKMAVMEVQDDDHVKQRPVSRREAMEREMQEVWGGLSLGNSIRPHVSRLERDKAAWIKAEEEKRGQ